MKKTIYLLVLLTLLFSCKREELKKTDWVKDGLLGKVKSVSSSSFNAIERNGTIEKDVANFEQSYYNLSRYDSKGNILERSSRETDGSVVEKYLYRYDEKGNMIEETLYYVTQDKPETHKYHYDDKGNMVRFEYFDAEGVVHFKGVLKYDKRDSLLEKSTYFANDEPFKKWIYKYDEKGNKIQIIQYQGENNFFDQWIYKYDGKGYIIEELYCTIKDKPERKTTYKYDDKGNRVEQNNYDFNAKTENRTVYDYDETGNQIKKVYYNADGDIVSKEFYTYDKWQRNTGIVSKNKDDKIKNEWNYIYTYDDKGNWIKEVRIENGIPVDITEREIVYFGEEQEEEKEIPIKPNAEKTTDIAYSDCSLAYLKQGKLYFYHTEQDKTVAFTEEPDTIQNFVFNNDGSTLYYGVEKDNMLWLKSVDIDREEITPEWLISWDLKEEDYYSPTSGENSPLLLYKGSNVVIRHNYSWDSYDFTSMSFYSTVNKDIIRKDFDYDIIEKLSGTLTDDKEEEYFKTINKQLYYIKNGDKVPLTDKLDIEALREDNYEDMGEETSYCSFILSKDEKKVAYGCLFGFGDLAHGVYCIANTDGSNQMALKNTDLYISYCPFTWGANHFFYLDKEKNLLVADNDKGTVVKIAEKVTDFKAK